MISPLSCATWSSSASCAQKEHSHGGPSQAKWENSWHGRQSFGGLGLNIPPPYAWLYAKLMTDELEAPPISTT